MKARFTIGDGREPALFRVLGGQVTFNNYPGSATLIQPGSTLALITSVRESDYDHPTLGSNRQAMLNNGGELVLAGALLVQGCHGGFTGIRNTGRLTIRGDAAGLERLPSSAGPNAFYSAELTPSQLRNLAGGELQGTGTFTYTNSTGNPEGRYLLLVNLGAIAPGSDQPGPLTFVNVNVRFGMTGLSPGLVGPRGDAAHPLHVGEGEVLMPGDPGLLRIQILDPAKFSSLRVTGTGETGRFDLADGVANTLNVVTPDGVLPHGTYRIVTAGAVKGTFATLQYNGKVPVPYTVQYLPDGITVEFP